METRSRSLAKALSWRLLALIVTTVVAWKVTGDTTFAAAIGAIDTGIKIFAYYAHERAWVRIPFGRRKEPEYYI